MSDGHAHFLEPDELIPARELVALAVHGARRGRTVRDDEQGDGAKRRYVHAAKEPAPAAQGHLFNGRLECRGCRVSWWVHRVLPRPCPQRGG